MFLKNDPILFATWEEALEVAKQSELKARINGVPAKMKEFMFFFCVMLAEQLLKDCDNLSKTIQSSSMPAVEACHPSELCVEVLQNMRSDSTFDLFWNLCLQTQEQLQVNELVLARQRQRPRSHDDTGKEQLFFFDDPKLYYRSIYF